MVSLLRGPYAVFNSQDKSKEPENYGTLSLT